jgi:lipopolysaccharide/colanic/teichoic acid biosynthesis glycosyltransferase
MYRNEVLKNIDPNILNFISDYMNLQEKSTKILKTSIRFNVDVLEDNPTRNLVNFKKINDIRWINKFFQSVNTKLPKDGIFIGCVESKDERKKRILKKFPKYISHIIYFADFIVNRVFAKLNSTKKIYFYFTRGVNRVLSLPETLGRLVSCGFEIVKFREINNLIFFVAKKEKEPVPDLKPSYGLIIKMPRIGKNGKVIHVYKLRTMHPYSEFLQDFIYKMHSLQEGGKFKNDFRITGWGRILRKFWIDELPMLFNWFTRELKLVGVRPLSYHYFNLYHEDLKQRRIKYKPGLFPPYYADMPTTLDEIMESERKYLNLYDVHPVFTDIKYFFKVLTNIIFKHARSA